MIGFLDSQSPERVRAAATAFRQGLKDIGYVEGENVAIEYRWAENQIDRLPALAADLVRRQVAVIAAVSEPATLAAKAATKTIPIVFGVATTRSSSVLSPASPGQAATCTGINFFTAELTAKRLELLRELMPAMQRVAVLVNPANSAIAEPALKDVQAAGARDGVANPSLQRQHQPRDRRGLCDTCAASGRTRSLSAPTRSSSAGACNLSHLATRHAVPAIYSVANSPKPAG